MTFSTTIYRKLVAGTALTLAVAAIAVPVAGAQRTLDQTNLPCWPTCPSFDTEPGEAIAGITDARHAGLLLRHRGDRGVEPGLISRPAPADGIAANAPASISAPVVDGPTDGFDYRDAFVGAIIALALVLLLLGAARLVQGHGRLAHR
jgi:hypothetical protein